MLPVRLPSYPVLPHPTPSYTRFFNQPRCGVCRSLPHPTPSYTRCFYHSTLSYLFLPHVTILPCPTLSYTLPGPTLDPPAILPCPSLSYTILPLRLPSYPVLPHPTPSYTNHILPGPTLDPPAILPCPPLSYTSLPGRRPSYPVLPHPTLAYTRVFYTATLSYPILPYLQTTLYLIQVSTWIRRV